MLTVFTLLVVWLVLTVLGHLSWIIFATIAKALVGWESSLQDRRSPQRSGEPIGENSRPIQDGFRVVLQQLVEAGDVSRTDAEVLVTKADRLLEPTECQLTESASPQHATKRIDTPPLESTVATPAPEAEILVARIVEEPDASTPILAQPPKLVQDESREQKVNGPAFDAPTDQSPIQRDPVPAKPKASLGQLVGAFLEDRNIRWGEIAAGLMIVLCSIGLVVSLWQTLTSTHRVIPSVIFIAANASIFAAGFYTHRRWRIRATSRAVLIIASLLVPLSALAGLAAAGHAGSQVSLMDPLVMSVVLVGFLVDACLLTAAGRTLVGKPMALAYAIASLAPVCMLPLMPMFVRHMEANAGWIVLVPSALVMLAWLMEPEKKRRARKKLSLLGNDVPDRHGLGSRGVVNRAIWISLGSFSLTCLVGYTAFLLKQTSQGLDGETIREAYAYYLPLALSVVPALVTLACLAKRYADVVLHPAWRLTGHCVAVSASLAILSLMAVVHGNAQWMWWWGLLVSASASIAFVTLRQWIWLPLGIFPACLAAVVTSSTWMGVETFESLQLFERLVSGPAVIVMSAIVAFHAVTSRRTHGRAITHGWRLGMVAWFVPVLALAAWIMFGDPSSARGMPPWSISASLLIVVAACWLSRWSVGQSLALAVLPLAAGHAINQWDPRGLVGIEALRSTESIFGWASILALVGCIGRWLPSTGDKQGHQGIPNWWAQPLQAALLRLDRIKHCDLYEKVAITLVAGSSVVWFSDLLFRQASPPNFETPLQTGLQCSFAWILVAIGLPGLFQQSTRPGWDRWKETYLGGLAIWVGSVAGWQFASDPDVQLIITGWTILSLMTAIRWGQAKWTGRADQVWATNDDWIAWVTMACVVATASTRLFITGWLRPFESGLQPDGLVTGTLVGWWLVMGMGMIGFPPKRFMTGSVFVGVGLVVAASALPLPWLGCSSMVTLTQGVGLAAFAWMLVLGRLGRSLPRASDDWRRVTARATNGLWATTWILGTMSCLLAVVGLVLQDASIAVVVSPAGVLLSITAVGWWTFGRSMTGETNDGQQSTGFPDWLIPGRLPWPVGMTMLSGQVMGYLVFAERLSVAQLPLVMSSVWVGIAIASLTRFARLGGRVDVWHALLMASLSWGLAIVHQNGASDPLFWPALTSVMVLGVWVVLADRRSLDGGLLRVFASIMGHVVAWGGLVHWGWIFAPQLTEQTTIGLAIGWLATWLVIWRWGCPDRGSRKAAVPDNGLTLGILIATLGLCFEKIGSSRPLDAVDWPFAVLVVGTFVAMSWTMRRRCRRRGVSEIWVVTFGSAFAWAGIHVASAALVDRSVWIGSGMLGFGLGLGCFSANFERITRWMLGSDSTADITRQRLLKASWYVGSGLVVAVIAFAFLRSNVGDRFAAHVAMGAMGMVAFAFAEFSECVSLSWRLALEGPSNRSGLRIAERFRTSALMTLLSVLVLLAVMESWADPIPELTASMRCLIAMLVAVPTLLFALPHLLGRSVANRWRKAFQRGSMVAAVIGALAALATMSLELTHRKPGVGIEDLPMPLVVLVAATFAGFGMLAALVACMSGPGGWLTEKLNLTDQHRRIVILSVQIFALFSWLHVYFCLDTVAFFGLRAYWPYTVMAIAFLSVGATEWAARRKDLVLTQQLRRTSLLLPLVPLAGFWLSTWVNGNLGSDLSNWMFGGGMVSYTSLLVLSAGYYLAVSVAWKRRGPRILGILLGNLALWVWLVQTPGWGFLTHPQAWLIPPAVCVMVIAHFSREELGRSLSTSIRTGATLVVYISSTADMLISDVGATLLGPIVLILLALLGMFAGAVFRLRSFLLLGVIFILVGLLSMVWHAQQAMDAVWPWWAFGITTGILILTALAMLEKNRPKLRQYASSFATWEV